MPYVDLKFAMVAEICYLATLISLDFRVTFIYDVDQSPYTEGKHGTWFRGKEDILTKVTNDSVQYW